MPNSKYKDLPKLTGKKKEYLDALLEARALVLGQMEYHAADALDSSSSDKRGVTTHMADLGSDNSRHEMELQMLTDEGDVLELIEDAIERLIEDDDFGKCIDCGCDIQEARLDVKPYALYCIKCKSIREKNDGINPFVD
jgi:DnaK suppressor protein